MSQHRKICWAIYLILPFGALFFLFYQNLPFRGILTQARTFDNHRAGLISYPYPENRLGKIISSDSGKLLPLFSDLAYFDVRQPVVPFEEIKLNLNYRRPDNVSELRLGRPGGPEQFQELLISQRFLDSLDWTTTVGDDYLTLWQKETGTKSLAIENFLDQPPTDQPIAIHQTAPTPQITLPEYRPASQLIRLPFSLKGRFSLVAYWQNEPLELIFNKNGTATSPETVKVFDYRNREILSVDITAAQEYKIFRPKLSPGRYKIDFNLAETSEIKNFASRFRYLMAKDQLTLGDLPEDSRSISFLIHTKTLLAIPSGSAGYQKISLAGETYRIQAPTEDLTLKLPATSFDQPAALNLEKGSVQLSFHGGYLSFRDLSHLFNPAPKNSFSFDAKTTDDELSRAGYILARYLPPQETGANFQSSSFAFAPSSLYFDPQEKSWPFALLSPGLEQDCNQIWLKSLSAEFIRPPLKLDEFTELLKKLI